MSMKTGAKLIAEERARQISVEGWTPEHDDKHRRRQLAVAAESYLATHSSPDVCVPRCPQLAAPCWNWPWAKKWWKPSPDPVRNLVKAGALIAAEIDRLQRKKSRKMKTIMLMCPDCGRTKLVQRELTDAPSAKRIVLRCDKCDRGGSFSESGIPNFGLMDH